MLLFKYGFDYVDVLLLVVLFIEMVGMFVNVEGIV